MKTSSLRSIPSVDRLLTALEPLDIPRRSATAIVRRELATLRKDSACETLDFDAVFARVRAAVEDLRRARLQPVINGTGVLIHTNLGRSPLPEAAVTALTEMARDYSNLEFDLRSGERGGRAAYLEQQLALVAGAEAATVVNNCAAALVLMLQLFTRRTSRREVIVSRGELVQIGGGFRIPEIMEASGVTLREVGTTNRTTLADYASVCSPATALILRVHRSNFYLEGFTETVSASDLAALAHRQRVPFAEDLGSGAIGALPNLDATDQERTLAQAVTDGAHLVCCSGDKLFGGPQAGIIVGKSRPVTALKKLPLFRAMRCDKLMLGALQATTDLYLSGRAEAGIPLLEMLRTPVADLRARAERMQSALAADGITTAISTSRAKTGGGTLPRAEVGSITLDFPAAAARSADEFASRLRTAQPPVIGYVSGGRFRLDLRTIFPRQDDLVLQAMRAAAR